MRRAVWAQLYKLATLPGWWLSLAAGAVAAVALVVLLHHSYPHTPASAVAALARGMVQAVPLALGALLGAAEYRHWHTALLATPRRAVGMVSRWLVAVAAGAVVATVMTLSVLVPLEARDWLASQAWFAGIFLAGFWLAELTRAVLPAVLIALAVLWVAPITLNGTTWTKALPDAAPLSGWDGVHWPVAAGWLAATALLATLRHRSSS